MCLAVFPAAAAQDCGDAIVSASISDARTLIPLLASDSASADICGMIYNGLVKYDKDLNLVGDLAERWEIQDNGLTIIFYLRKDVRWHDGAPFSAEDVAFTFNAVMDPLVKTPYRGDFERVRSLEVVDPLTVRITYKEPFAPALSSWGMSILPKHILAGKDLNTTPLSRAPVGTGPYRLKSWKTQQKIELVSFPGYFERPPCIGRTVARVIPDAATIFLELQTQGIDSAGLSPLQYRRQTDSAFFAQQYRKFRFPSFSYVYMGYNLRSELFADIRVRRAINAAVDKEEIISMVLLGLGRAATGPFIPESWAFNGSVTPAPFDPALAKKLLAEAGWKDTDADGWLERNGRRFSFTLISNQGNEERSKTAQIIQRRLKEVGIEVKIQIVEWSVFLSEYIDKRRFDAVLLGWSLPREPDNFDIWHSSKTGEGEFNFVSYANPEVDELLERARRTFELSERARCYRRIHAILYEEQPYLFLYVPDSLPILHRRFRGVEPAPAGIGYNFIEWWVPKNEQRYSRFQP